MSAVNFFITRKDVVNMSTKAYTESRYKVVQTLEFQDWFDGQSERFRSQISGRIEKIQSYGYFGDHKSVSDYEKGVLKDAVWELRWKDGRRVYYAYTASRKVL